MKTILCLDDSTCALRLLERVLKADYRVHCCPTPDEALEVMAQHQLDCFILDYNLSDGDGVSFAQSLRADPRYAETPILLLSAAITPDLAYRAMKCGINQCLAKPYTPGELKTVVRAQIARPTIHRVERAEIAAMCLAWQRDNRWYEYSPDTGKLVSARTPEAAHAQMHEFLSQWVRQAGGDCDPILEPTLVQHPFTLE